MKQHLKTITNTKKKVVVWGIAVLLSLIPISALAAYMKEPIAQKEQPYMTCIDNHCKLVATITPPPKARYEVVIDNTRNAIKVDSSISSEEMQRRMELSERIAKQMETAMLKDGKLSIWERFTLAYN